MDQHIKLHGRKLYKLWKLKTIFSRLCFDILNNNSVIIVLTILDLIKYSSTYLPYKKVHTTNYNQFITIDIFFHNINVNNIFLFSNHKKNKIVYLLLHMTVKKIKQKIIKNSKLFSLTSQKHLYWKIFFFIDFWGQGKNPKLPVSMYFHI